jgi:sugar lactone lactonase YvrE
VKRLLITGCGVAATIVAICAVPLRPVVRLAAQGSQNANVPKIPFDTATDFLKYSPDMNLGEVLGVAVNSKGLIVVLNHPGSATSGPIYGNASTQLLLFDPSGKFVREIGKGVYGLGYAHSVRFDKYDNLWVVDKGVNTVVKFNPAWYVTLNLGRRPEGPDDPEEFWFRGGRGANATPPVHVDGQFRAPTDVAWDSDDNIYISDGYTNSRVAKFDKHGNWVTSWGSRGRGGVHADENPSQFNTPHNIGVDRQNNVYVADRGNRRIQVFDASGKFLRMLHLNAPYDKTRHPVLGNTPTNAPDETQPWTICITNTPTQYLYTSDQEPGRIYKMTLDGRILGVIGESGHEPGQFNWIHGIACPSEDLLYVADMNNWRVQRIQLHPDRIKSTAGTK